MAQLGTYVPDKIRGSTSVEPGIETTPAAQHASTCIDYAVFGDETLGRGYRGKVGEGSTKPDQFGDVEVTIGMSTSFKEQDGGVL